MSVSLVELQESALSVAGITDYIQLLLEGDTHLRQIWIVGEVSSAHSHARGCFFTLQEPDGSAILNCVVWNSQLDKLATLPKVGEQVVVLGQIRLYPKRGSYQLTVWQVLPGGDGLQSLRYRQLRRRLAEEGLFAPERKRSLPAYPEIIAVVTSEQAAAWGDIQRTLGQRHPGLRVLLAPAIVQGDQAPGSIAAAIERVGQDGRAQVLILARGGGAVEDLACFDDERVVRAIATCPIPIITGIGHERDESLADLVSDVAAHTPTAAAERAVPALIDLYGEQAYLIQQLSRLVGEHLYQSQRQLQQCCHRLQQIRLDRQLQQTQQQQAWQQQRLCQALTRRVQQAQHQQQLLQEKLATLDPEAVLRRGYALVRQDSGALVTTATALTLNETITLQLGQGQAKATIIEINHA